MIYVDGHMDRISDKHRIQCTERWDAIWYSANVNGIPAKICNDNYVDIYYYVNYADYTNDKDKLQ